MSLKEDDVLVPLDVPKAVRQSYIKIRGIELLGIQMGQLKKVQTKD